MWALLFLLNEFSPIINIRIYSKSVQKAQKLIVADGKGINIIDRLTFSCFMIFISLTSGPKYDKVISPETLYKSLTGLLIFKKETLSQRSLPGI